MEDTYKGIITEDKQWPFEGTERKGFYPIRKQIVKELYLAAFQAIEKTIEPHRSNRNKTEGGAEAEEYPIKALCH